MGAYRHNIRRYRFAYDEKRGCLYPPFASCIGAPRAQRDTADIADKAPDFLHRERSEIRRMLAGPWRMLALPMQGVCSPLLPAWIPLAVCLRPRPLRYRSPRAPRAASPRHAAAPRAGQPQPPRAPRLRRGCAAVAALRAPRARGRGRAGNSAGYERSQWYSMVLA